MYQTDIVVLDKSVIVVLSSRGQYFIITSYIVLCMLFVCIIWTRPETGLIVPR